MSAAASVGPGAPDVPAERVEESRKSRTDGEKRRSRDSLWPARSRRSRVDVERQAALVAGRRAVLCVDSVSVSFDGFKALDALTLVLDEGELRCVIGPNGAGKTTLMDVITGRTQPDEGNVFLVENQLDLTDLPEYEIAKLGVCRKFQRPTVFQGHTVFENLELALDAPKGVFRTLFARLRGEQRDAILEALETIGLSSQKDTRAGQLSHGQKQWLEIGMLLVQNPRVLLLDEPVAGMTHKEAERTAELFLSLAGKRTLVVVEHDMEFVRSIARTVTVLHEGRVLAEGSLDAMQQHPKVIEVYLGESQHTRESQNIRES